MPPQKPMGKITQRTFKVLGKILQKEMELALNVCLFYNPPINFGTIFIGYFISHGEISRKET